jgi:thiol-disulfide isomerase/thioredoxin
MKFDRRTIMLGAAFAAFLGGQANATNATNGVPFNAAAFKAAVAAGKTVVVEITAKWCGPCQRQRPVVAAVLTKSEYAGLTVFDADFDVHKNSLAVR